jgi:hypothetical protein
MLKISRFDFECRWQKPAFISPFPGSMLRGALGRSLKMVVCAIRQRTCEDCLLVRQCLYARIFERKPVEGQKLNLSSLPHPFVIAWQPSISRRYDVGERFRFSLILFGDYIDMLPYFVYAVDRMGADGLGGADREGKRATAVLERVSCGNTMLYTRDHPELPAAIPYEVLDVAGQAPADPAANVSIVFETPLRVKKDGRFARDLDFTTIMQAVTRRLKGLWACYGTEPGGFDLNAVMSQARTIRTVDKRLNWLEQKRYSNRQATEMQMGGVSGRITFAGDLTTLLPLLETAEKVHIGKATSFGLGRIVVAVDQ